MLNETYPNERPHRHSRLAAIGLPEVGFAVGFGLAVVGVSGWLGVWIALLAAGIALMAVTWRLA